MRENNEPMVSGSCVRNTFIPTYSLTTPYLSHCSPFTSPLATRPPPLPTLPPHPSPTPQVPESFPGEGTPPASGTESGLDPIAQRDALEARLVTFEGSMFLSKKTDLRTVS